MKHPMTVPRIRGTRRISALKLPLLVLAAMLTMPISAAKADIRIAYGDIPSIEALNMLIAVERTRERGVDVELNYFDSEDVAAQAVVGGQADIGVGAPYGLIQRARVPIRMIYQLSTLQFFPVVNSERYQNWEDLAGEPITVHSRGSGTEALMKMMAQQKGFDYKEISYMPGSEVRAGAMLQGRIHATIVDSANFRVLMEKGGDKFKRLPLEDVSATDEALYATEDFIKNSSDDLQVLLEEMLRTWRDIADDPAIVAKLRDKYNLLPDLPQDMENEMVPFYRNSVENGVFPPSGGTMEAMQGDVSFYAIGGQIEGDPEDVDPAEFWNLKPLQQARQSLGN